MENITKKLLIITGLLIFSCSTNFCMQNDMETIKGPYGKWKAIIKKDGIVNGEYKQERVQVVNTEEHEKTPEHPIVSKCTNQLQEDRILFSFNGKYAAFEGPCSTKSPTAPIDEVTVLTLGEYCAFNCAFKPSLEHDPTYFCRQYIKSRIQNPKKLYTNDEFRIFTSNKNQWYPEILNFKFSPWGDYIVIKASFQHLSLLEYTYITWRIFNLDNKKDVTKEILPKIYKMLIKSKSLKFSPKVNLIEIETFNSAKIIFDIERQRKIIDDATKIRYSTDKKHLACKTNSQFIREFFQNEYTIVILKLKPKINLRKKNELTFDKKIKDFCFLTPTEISNIRWDSETEILNRKKEKIEMQYVSPKDIILKVEFEYQKPQFISIESRKIKVNKKRTRRRLIDAMVVCKL